MPLSFSNPFLSRVCRFSVLAVSSCALALASTSHAMTNEQSNTVLAGFAKYQADRVEQLVLDEFARDLADSAYFKQFLPKTSAAIKTYDDISSRRLIRTIAYYFDQDLENLVALGECLRLSLEESPPVATADMSEYTGLSVMGRMERLDGVLNFFLEPKQDMAFYLYNYGCTGAHEQSATAPAPSSISHWMMENMTAEVEPRSESFRNLVPVLDKFKQPVLVFAEIIQTLQRQAHEESALDYGVRRVTENFGYTTFPGFRLYHDLHQLPTMEGAFLDYDEAEVSYARIGDKYAALLHFRDSSGKNPQRDFPFEISATFIESLNLKAMVTALDEMKVLNEKFKASGSAQKNYHAYMHQLFLLIDSLGYGKDHAEFTKLKSAGLFLASVTDAVNSTQPDRPEVIAAAIREFVDEKQAHNSKRSTVALYTSRPDQPDLHCRSLVSCQDTWFIGSYYGVAYDSKHHWRAFAPVGLEFKALSFPAANVTLMAAPLDIGAYVTNELRGEAYDPNVEDVLAPSYFISINSRYRPFAVQIGYQNDITQNDGRKRDTWFTALSFDLPIYTVW